MGVHLSSYLGQTNEHMRALRDMHNQIETEGAYLVNAVDVVYSSIPSVAGTQQHVASVKLARQQLIKARDDIASARKSMILLSRLLHDAERVQQEDEAKRKSASGNQMQV